MTLLLVFAVVLLIAVLLSAMAHRTVLSTAVLFLAAGFLVGDGVLGLVHVTQASPIAANLAELALFVVLFTDGMRVGRADIGEPGLTAHTPGTFDKGGTMRKLLTITSAALMAMGALVYSEPSAWADTNLITNPSLETAANATTPASWQSGAWGTNATTFSYLSTGHSGTRSVKVQTTSYTDGDAKWYFAPVTVTPNATYTFSDYYQATVSTRLVVQFTTTGNGISYVELAPAPATTGSTWGQTTQTVTAPANAQSATVFHLLDKVGTLTIDDASLTSATTPPPPTELVPNASVEVASAGQPADWASGAWGGNTATFSYLTTGHTGSRSVKATLSNYTSGDAKWYFTPVTVTPGLSYAFSDWYKSDVGTELIAQFTRPDGSLYYQSIATVAVSSAWQQVTSSVSIPSDVNKLTVFHVLAANGSLTLDRCQPDRSSGTPIPANLIRTPRSNRRTALFRCPGAPADGKNTAAFTYTADGHTGSHSVQGNRQQLHGRRRQMDTPAATARARQAVPVHHLVQDQHATARCGPVRSRRRHGGIPDPAATPAGRRRRDDLAEIQ